MGEGGVGRDFEILYAHCNCALVRFFFSFGVRVFHCYSFFSPSHFTGLALYHGYLAACKIYCTK